MKDKMRILLCFGTRPEAIKMCSLVHELKKNDNFDVKICVTAQHREMLDQVIDFFEIVPDYDLNIMKSNQSLNEVSGNIFNAMNEILVDANPDLTLVHGDTTTSTICAWASFNMGIKVGHVEAGLRTFNKQSPFPEEMNRQLTGKIADFHFAPTVTSESNLLSEGIVSESIVVTGNTVIDSLLWTINKIDGSYTNLAIESLRTTVDFTKRVILVTAHRRENLGEGIINICRSILAIAEEHDVEVIFPVHLNPNVKKPVHELLGNTPNIHLTEPLDYPSFVWVMKSAYLILSDSGGIQEEAPSLGIPVLVMRDTTERPEAAEAGTIKLVGTDYTKIVNTVTELLENDEEYSKMSKSANPYGTGESCEKIIDFIKEIKR